jgi:hypothetical protein
VPDIPGNEDCLFLNVYAPAHIGPLTKLPVLVWIHGGGYGYGDGTQNMTEIILANNKGFVAVTIQYRVTMSSWNLDLVPVANGRIAWSVWLPLIRRGQIEGCRECRSTRSDICACLGAELR